MTRCGLALRVGYIGPWVAALDVELTMLHGEDGEMTFVNAQGSLRATGVQLTTNLELVRTRGI